MALPLARQKHHRCRAAHSPRMALPLARQKLPRYTASGAAEIHRCRAPRLPRMALTPCAAVAAHKLPRSLPLSRQKTTVAALRACQEWHSRRAPLSRHTNCRAALPLTRQKTRQNYAPHSARCRLRICQDWHCRLRGRKRGTSSRQEWLHVSRCRAPQSPRMALPLTRQKTRHFVTPRMARHTVTGTAARHGIERRRIAPLWRVAGPQDSGPAPALRAAG